MQENANKHTNKQHDTSPSLPSHYLFKPQGKQWQINTELIRQLLLSHTWEALPANAAEATPFHLLLGDRGRVNYAHLVNRKSPLTSFSSSLSGLSRLNSTLILVNSYRGCNGLTNKSAMEKTMRNCRKEKGGE